MSDIKKVNIAEGLASFSDYWQPMEVGRVNDTSVRFAKLSGAFEWHSHDDEDEMFVVMDGALNIELRERVIELNVGEMVIIPRGIEHRPVAQPKAHIMLMTPHTSCNTGEITSERTRDVKQLEAI